ncbi:MAG: DUF2489 domain-containing protein [Saccharospirillaceae bacterium]|nr:DUF2489 domain-containing protein [Pseudomonadales bacterium]NRB80572.1 DUF2489 domain-containing protein [Saccharospirillaceae bacterium]
MIWIVVAVLIVLGLASYASFLYWTLFNNKKKNQIALKKSESEQVVAEQKHQNYLQTSLHVIAKSALNGELNFSEGCIRIKVLLDNLNFEMLEIDGLNKTQFAIVDDVYEQLQIFDTHQARKELSDKERKQQDRKRHFIEVKNQEMLHSIFEILADKFKIIPE